MDLFRNANEALKFAFNYSSQQYALSPMAKMMKTGIVGTGKGLVSTDGAAQAGLIKAELERLPSEYKACIIARFSPKYEDCKCCGGNKMLDEYKESVARLDKAALDRGWITGLSLRQMRFGLIRAFYEKNIKITALAEDLNVAKRTAYDQKARIWKSLKELDADAQAVMGDGLSMLFGDLPRPEVKMVQPEFPVEPVAQAPKAEGATLVCPACNGEPVRHGIAFFNAGEDSADHKQAAVTIECPLCSGTGKVSEKVFRRHDEGRKHRDGRLARRETLYAASIRLGIRPAELSAHEHGYKDLPKVAAKKA